MAGPTAFVPLFAQIPDFVASQDNQVFSQDYQNSDLVSDVASVLGAEVEQPSSCFVQEEPEVGETSFPEMFEGKRLCTSVFDLGSLSAIY